MEDVALIVGLARQPIFDRSCGVYGYEILYRTAEGATAASIGGEVGAEAIANALTTVGLDTLVGERRAFVNLATEQIVGGIIPALPPERVVLEVLETVEPTEGVLESLNDAVASGYDLALDDFTYDERFKPLLELACYVKVDVLGKSPQALAKEAKALRPFGVQLVAEKVESRAVFNTCLDIGFDYFQGFFHCKPEFIRARIQQTNRVAVVRLIGELCKPDVTVAQVEEMIAQDSGLAYRLLRYVRSAFVGAPRNLGSLSQAVAFLGFNTVRALAMLILAGSNDKADTEVFHTGLIRAKLCARLAQLNGVQDTGAYFLTGLLSVLPALMKRPIGELLPPLPVSEDIKEALTGQSNDLRDALRCVIAWERGMWEMARYGGLAQEQIRDAYLAVLSEASPWLAAWDAAA
ncbi:MAG: HDOD domain-containing protein [Armatimonadota bacterium]